jgi:hypothetical protein
MLCTSCLFVTCEIAPTTYCTSAFDVAEGMSSCHHCQHARASLHPCQPGSTTVHGGGRAAGTVAFILLLPDVFGCAVLLPLLPCLALGVVRGWQDYTRVPGCRLLNVESRLHACRSSFAEPARNLHTLRSDTRSYPGCDLRFVNPASVSLNTM